MRVRKLKVGPIVGQTTHNRVRLWGRGKKRRGRIYGVAQLQGPDGVHTQFFPMRSHFDYTGITDFTGLEPAQSYHYRMGYCQSPSDEDVLQTPPDVLDWDDSSWHDFRTAPDDPTDISFVFGSCRYLDRFEIFDARGDKVFRSIQRQREGGVETHALLMVGDQIYADDFSIIFPSSEPKHYFKRYREAFGQEHIQKLMATLPTYMIMDDHEFRNNWDMDDVDSDPDRRYIFTSALRAYHSYQVVHSPAFIPAADPHDIATLRRYYHFDCGRASFFMMDTRTERYPSKKRMISTGQMEALAAWLRSKRDRVKFIATSVPFFPDEKPPSQDKWSGFPEQRYEILELIRSEALHPVVFLSGDLHCSGWATLTSARNDCVIHQIISSPWYWPGSPGAGRDELFEQTGDIHNGAYTVSAAHHFTNDDNFTRVTLDGNALHIQVYGRKGKALGDKTLAL